MPERNRLLMTLTEHHKIYRESDDSENLFLREKRSRNIIMIEEGGEIEVPEEEGELRYIKLRDHFRRKRTAERHNQRDNPKFRNCALI